jgi:hypothetical protein
VAISITIAASMLVIRERRMQRHQIQQWRKIRKKFQGIEWFFQIQAI